MQTLLEIASKRAKMLGLLCVTRALDSTFEFAPSCSYLVCGKRARLDSWARSLVDFFFLNYVGLVAKSNRVPCELLRIPHLYVDPHRHRLKAPPTGNVTWLIHMCDTTYAYVPWLLYVCRDSFICAMTHSWHLMDVPWLIRMWHDAFICGMTHSYVTWCIHMCHDSFVCTVTHSYVPWLICMCRDSFICAMTHFWHLTNVPWLMRMWHDALIHAVTQSYVP